ncbi:Fur family transcriptional regulator [Sinobacterium caligoides]|nr:transcriptional repressor [Sinobacterium caligoides]
MKNIKHIIDHAEQHCAKHGARLTRKRKQVLSGLLTSTKALSAYELIGVCKEECGETLPVMSIYRILDFLVDENLAHKLDLANKYIACEHISCSHPHVVSQFLICRHCSKVREISVNRSVIDDFQASAQSAGFPQISSQLELSCICEECLNESG